MSEGFAGHTPGEPFGDVRAGVERDVHQRIGFDQPDLPANEWRDRYYRADQRANTALDRLDSLIKGLEEEIERLQAKSARNHAMVHWAQADRLREILAEARNG
jgi:hypothetical protein